ncbi:histidinol dehydrogenase [Puccinia sorghi]|uniref:Histidine biosynthesis trifunctional protein n=1 Tax=Puccinia sorghi TaxID=27349 RepID=A0A0L6VEP2_9BASI|nr:histidinol dehydrogenase [Puccinia sorghi]
MSFAHLPFLPFIDSITTIPEKETINILTIFTPFLIAASIADQITPLLPANSHYYIYDDLNNNATQIINLLDLGAYKVISPLSQELINQGVPTQRIIHRLSSSTDNNLDDFAPESVLLEIQPNSDNSQHAINSLQKFNKFKDIFLLDATKDFTKGISDKNLVHIIPSAQLIKLSSDQLIDLFLSSLKSDRPDGLFSTSVVANSPSSTLLGQVYSSFESIKLTIKTHKATYFSRSRNQLWIKGETSGATQECVRIRVDCDRDSLEFQVIQKPSTGFCHTEEISCFGPIGGLKQLESTLLQRQHSSPAGSYTNRLFTDEKLLKAKIMEEAEELCQAETPSDVTGEMADLLYFALCRCISKGVSLADIEYKLNQRSLKVTRRKGDAKPKWEDKMNPPIVNPAAPSDHQANGDELRCQMIELAQIPTEEHGSLLKRPITDSKTMSALVTPIIEMVKTRGDEGLLEAVKKFDRCVFEDSSELTLCAPFSRESMEISPEIKEAIDVAYDNIYKFHNQQLDKERSPMVVETMKGVVCSRFARPIDRVGLYVPGGTAILPSTALMLAIPAQVAGCEHISIATPARADGTISAEIMYIAGKCGVKQIVKAGGAHAIAALAYGTNRVSKVDKIFGPGNQFVTLAKMLVSSDVHAATAIDMPAGPSEVLVIADQSCNPVFVAADLLSQAEHGVDSQVILLAVNLSDQQISEIEAQINLQARQLSRLHIIRQSIPKSFIVKIKTLEQAFHLSNQYAPEHLILHVHNAAQFSHLIKNAGSVFVGPFSPESCGDYASGTNHSLPTVGFAKQYSGVSTMSFMKHITSQQLTKEGLDLLGPTVVRLATLEGLDGHANAVNVRLTAAAASVSSMP